MEEIKLSLTVEEVNQILEGLGSIPFKDVFSLIGKIKNQANITGNVFGDKLIPGNVELSDNSIKIGNVELSDNSIKIGNTSITENELGILKRLASNSLKIRIRSSQGSVLENYKKRFDDGDSMRSIQFSRRPKSNEDTEFKFEIV